VLCCLIGVFPHSSGVGASALRADQLKPPLVVPSVALGSRPVMFQPSLVEAGSSFHFDSLLSEAVPQPGLGCRDMVSVSHVEILFLSLDAFLSYPWSALAYLQFPLVSHAWSCSVGAAGLH
jgi:hypothetical protein